MQKLKYSMPNFYKMDIVEKKISFITLEEKKFLLKLLIKEFISYEQASI